MRTSSPTTEATAISLVSALTKRLEATDALSGLASCLARLSADEAQARVNALLQEHGNVKAYVQGLLGA